VRLETGGTVVAAPLIEADLDDGDVLLVDDDVLVFDAGDVHAFRWPEAQVGVAGVAASDGLLISPMPGRIVSVGAEEGQRVKKGQAIVTLEAMKMEHALTAPFDGKLAALNVKAGDQVAEGVTLARIEAEG
jgi:propionyl-CoA carboxylase alpha chain/3-methylcrotonyl-CoA carboxylase alpha subunit